MPAYDLFDLALRERELMLQDLERRRGAAQRAAAASPAIAAHPARREPRGLLRFLPGRA